MGTSFAVALQNRIFDATDAEKNDKLLFCVGSVETCDVHAPLQGPFLENNLNDKKCLKNDFSCKIKKRCFFVGFNGSS